MVSVFGHHDYKAYLNKVFATQGQSRGLRSKLAEELGCKSAFISKVLKGSAHFSPESGVAVSKFLKLTEEEEEYFLLLLQHARAGSHFLEKHYQRQIDRMLEARKNILSRVDAKEVLTESEKITYYSSWMFVAIHVLVSIAKFQTREAIARCLKLSEDQAAECLSFLVSTGIIAEKNGKYQAGSARIHLSKDSPLVKKHHSNWRIQAIQATDRKSKENLHYSLVFSASEKDMIKIRDLIMSQIELVDGIMRPSPEEAAFCFNIDFFRI